MYFHLTLKYNNDTTLKYNVHSIDKGIMYVENNKNNRHNHFPPIIKNCPPFT